jgi:hypothetical protein
MLAIYASTALIAAASLIIGRAILAVCGRPRPVWLSGATGFAVLVIVSPFLVRLPGRATTAAIVLGALVLAGAFVVVRDQRRSSAPAGVDWPLGVAVALIVVGLGTLPFLFNDRIGVLGEGIYTNDHAAQLYWADWLQHGFGPEPSAVRFGYPVGPQAVAAISATVTGTTLISAFNGLLLVIPMLTALAALGALGELPAGRRVAVAVLIGIPYLAASFLAQSSFKETAMAMFVLAFAVAIGTQSGVAATRPDRPPGRAVIAVCLLLGAASVFTFSLPGLAWFAIALPLWLIVEAIGGRNPIDYRRAAGTVREHRALTIVTCLVLIAVAAFAIGPATSFVGKINDVNVSIGRLSSPVFGGEALGIWPQGDFRIVRGEVSGAWIAVAVGALAVAYGAWALYRRRQFAILAVLVTGAIDYVGAREFAQIHVQAKALVVIAPLVLLVSLRALAAPDGPATGLRYAAGVLVGLAALGSTLLALRAAPVGFDDRQVDLERLADKIDGRSVVFLGVDRFSGYYLRGTLMRAPAGYVPQDIASRPEKAWQQGWAADFDNLEPAKLDKFDYAITTDAAYASTPPPNFVPVDRSGDYVLWKRDGDGPRSRVLREGGDPGAILDCQSAEGRRLSDRKGTAVVLQTPVVVDYTDWRRPPLVDDAAGGQELAFDAPGTALADLNLPAPGRYRVSLQYHSQVPLTVLYEGRPIAHLPPSLDGMYLSGAGRGAFWPAGGFSSSGAGTRTISVRAADPTGLQDALGVERRVWLGDLAASSTDEPRAELMKDACGDYVDHFTLERGKKGSR